MDKFAEGLLCVVAAVALVAVTVWIMRLKLPRIMRLIVNSLAGGALVAGLSAFNIITLPFNALNAVLVGVFGLPGAAVVVAAALIL